MTERTRRLICVGLLAASCVAVYGGSLGGAFIYDDLPHIVHNSGLHAPGDFGSALNSGYQETRPVFLASVALNYWGSGPEPFGFHLVNLLLHICCCLLVYRLAGLLHRDAKLSLPWFPELAALLFAVHPLATEAVTYINSRSGLLAAAFGLAALLLVLSGRRWWAVVPAVLAMGSKESAVVVPVLAVAYLVLVRRERSVRALARQTLPVLATVAVVPLLFLLADNPHEGTIGGGTLPWVDHWLTQPRVLAYFMYLVCVPVHQNIDYDFPVSHGPELAVLGSVVLLVAMAGLLWRFRSRAVVPVFGGVWWFVAIAPTNSVVPFKDFIAERHLYLPLVGFALAAGWAAAEALRRRRVMALAGIALYCCSLAGLTVARNQVLSSPLLLWQQTVAASPDKARPHVNLGILLLNRGERELGYYHLSKAVALEPNDAAARYNLGVFHERSGQLELAVQQLRAAVGIRPTAKYRRSFAHNAGQLAADLHRRGNSAAAAPLLKEALAADPGAPVLHYNYAVVLLALGQPQEARAQLEETLRLQPGHDKARRRLAELD